MHILLIEDNTDHIFLAREAIEGAWEDATLHIANDIIETEALLEGLDQQLQFDLLIASVNTHDQLRLPQLSRLRSSLSSKSEHIPLILLVNSTRDQQLAQVANHPDGWILLKPLRAKALREAFEHEAIP